MLKIFKARRFVAAFAALWFSLSLGCWNTALSEQSTLPVLNPTFNGDDCASQVARDLAHSYIALIGSNPETGTYADQFRDNAQILRKDPNWVVLKPLGDCFFDRHQWVWARTAYERALANSNKSSYPMLPAEQANAYQRLSVIAQHFGNATAAKHYSSAFVAAHNQDYNASITPDERFYREGWPEEYTPDEIRVIQEHGGTPKSVEAGLPCHHEIFTSGDKTQDTWWYCTSDGQYTESYTFINGTLGSTYQP